jgi:hypothetical protein
MIGADFLPAPQGFQNASCAARKLLLAFHYSFFYRRSE